MLSTCQPILAIFRFFGNVAVRSDSSCKSNSCIFVLHCLFQSDGFLKDNNNAAQRLLDGVKYISQSVSELSVKPAKAVTSWLTDQIAPAYWKPNSLIMVRNILC